MNRTFAALAAFLGLTCAGCGLSPGQLPFGCDVSTGGMHRCTDYALEDQGSGDLSNQQAVCTQSGGTIVSGCSHSSAVGGCQTFHPDPNGGQGMTVSVWFYTPMTAAQVMTTCEQAGYQFLSP